MADWKIVDDPARPVELVVDGRPVRFTISEVIDLRHGVPKLAGKWARDERTARRRLSTGFTAAVMRAMSDFFVWTVPNMQWMHVDSLEAGMAAVDEALRTMGYRLEDADVDA